MLIISEFRRLRQEDGELKASLGYRVRLCLKNKQQPPHTHQKKKKNNTPIPWNVLNQLNKT
jgi:hypothetical protein